MMQQRSTKGASKQRRDCINSEINEIRDYLPMNDSVKRRLSQLQIMALCKAYITKSNCFNIQPVQVNAYDRKTSLAESFDFSQALPGFLLVTTLDGKIIYLSENVTEYLGHSMVDLMTQAETMYDIIDSRHHARIRDFIVSNRLRFDVMTSCVDSSQNKLVMTCHMNLGRLFRRNNIFDRQKIVKMTGRLIWPDVDLNLNDPIFVACCSTLLNGSPTDIAPTVVDTMTFYTSHTTGMKYISIDHNGEHHIGYDRASLQGQSWYQFLHPADVDVAARNHLELNEGGYDATKSFCVRMQTKYGHFVWLHVIMKHGGTAYSNTSDTTPQHILCLNHVISEQEANDIKAEAFLEETMEQRSQPTLMDIMTDPLSLRVPTVVVSSEFLDQTAGQFEKNNEVTHKQLMMKLRCQTLQNRNKRVKCEEGPEQIGSVFDGSNFAPNAIKSSDLQVMSASNVFSGGSVSARYLPQQQPVDVPALTTVAGQLFNNSNLDNTCASLLMNYEPLTPPSDSESSRDWVDSSSFASVIVPAPSNTPPYSPSPSFSRLEDNIPVNVEEASFFDSMIPAQEKQLLKSVVPAKCLQNGSSLFSNVTTNSLRVPEARPGRSSLSKLQNTSHDFLPVLDQSFVANFFLDVEHKNVRQSVNPNQPAKQVVLPQKSQHRFSQNDASAVVSQVERQRQPEMHMEAEEAQALFMYQPAAVEPEMRIFERDSFVEMLNGPTFWETIEMMSSSDMLLE